MAFRSLGVWPFPDTSQRRSRRTFRAPWSDTLIILDRELEHLAAENIVCQAAFTEADIRLDGLPRSNARTPRHPGVILSFESVHGPLQYSTDTHEFWEHNVRGIALGLEALRAVDRYGITKTGQQYTGWRQLTAGSGLTTREEALSLIRTLTGDTTLILNGADSLPRVVYNRALKRAHPDGGGSPDRFAAVRDAGRLLGVSP